MMGTIAVLTGCSCVARTSEADGDCKGESLRYCHNHNGDLCERKGCAYTCKKRGKQATHRKGEERKGALRKLAQWKAALHDDPPAKLAMPLDNTPPRQRLQDTHMCSHHTPTPPHRISSAKKQTTAVTRPMMAMTLASAHSLSCSGVFSGSLTTSASVRPHSLCGPTASTSTLPLPSDTLVPLRVWAV